MSSEAPVAIAVLGEVTLHDERGRDVPLQPQKREILAALAAAAGATVPREALQRAIWSESPEDTRNRLKSHVNQLRAMLDRGLTIEFRNGGYRLCGPLELLDITLFESLVARARELPPGQAVERYSLALRLWRRGTPFTNVSNALVDAAARRLLVLRDEVVLALADAEIALQRPTLAHVHLEELFDDDPARGDLARRLALLHALAEREVEALRVLQRHREALAELGAVVAPEVQQLESRILMHQVGPGEEVDEAVTTTAAATPGWLARRRLVDRLGIAVEHRPVLLVGEPGVGKTALTRMLEQRLDATGGAIVVRAAVLPEPYRPMDVVASIAEQLEATFPARMREALADPVAATALARIAAGPDRTPRSPTTREALLGDLIALLATVLDSTDALLVVEDAHWLDASSADVLAGLVRRRRARLLITSRPAVPRALAELREAPEQFEVIEVPPFDADEVEELIHQALPLRASDELAAELLRQTGGNPLFLGLSLDVLARGELGSDVPPTLQRAVDERTAGLSRATREVLQLAALLGHTFPVEPLRHVRPRALEALRIGEEEGLIRVDEDHATAHFAHGLVASALATTVPGGARSALHDELCRALIAGGHAAVAIGAQAIAAADLDPVRAIVAARDAAAEQAAVFEWGQVIDWAQRGLAIVDRCGMTGDTAEAELRLLLGTGLRRSNRGGSDVELLVAAEIAWERGAEALYASAVTEACLHGPTSQAGKVDPRVRRHLDRALRLQLDDAPRAELLSAAATLMALSDESERGRTHYLEARRLALRSGHPSLVRTVSMNAHLGLEHPDDLPLRWDAAHELERFPDDEAQWEAAFLQFGLGLITADRALVDRAHRRLSEVTPLVLQRPRARGLGQIESVHAFVRGDAVIAERLADEALAIALEAYSESWSLSIYAALILPIREAQGRQGELWPVISGVVRANPEYMTWHAVASSVGYALGDREVMRDALRALREHELRFVLDLTWSAATTITSRAVWALGDVDMARDLYEILAPSSGQMTWNGLSTHGPVDAGLALLADTFGDDRLAARHARTARALVDRLGAPHLWWSELDRLGAVVH